jgi:outer membrane lipoprotein-sorting protein
MNRFLRTAPTRRLLSVLAGICLVIVAGSTLAIAASGDGPVPPPQPLARAIHSALAAPTVPGIAATITLKNSLIDASELQGTDPLLAGGSGRLWVSSDHRFRLELQTDGGAADAQVVYDRGRFWAYDPASNTVYEGSIAGDTTPARRSGQTAPVQRGAHRDAIPSVATIQQNLNRLMVHLGISGAIPSDVAGQPTYTVRVSPKDPGGLIGGAELAWDAARGIPLRMAVYARGDTNPVLELAATNVSYGPQPESVFSIAPPAGAKVVRVATHSVSGQAHRRAGRHPVKAQRAEITGVSAVASRLPFPLDCPGSLAGLDFSSARLLDVSGHPGALLVYGHGLGAIMVLEQPAQHASARLPQASGDGPGLKLPTVPVNGVSGQEIDTALGTLVRFTRSGVSYTVAGSVKPAVADAAARGL